MKIKLPNVVPKSERSRYELGVAKEAGCHGRDTPGCGAGIGRPSIRAPRTQRDHTRSSNSICLIEEVVIEDAAREVSFGTVENAARLPGASRAGLASRIDDRRIVNVRTHVSLHHENVISERVSTEVADFCCGCTGGGSAACREIYNLDCRSSLDGLAHV